MTNLSSTDRASELLDAGFKVLPLGAIGEEPPQWVFSRNKTDSVEEVQERWTKTPRVSWKKYRDNLDRWEELEKELSQAPTNTNLGIVTGEGIVVVDADSAEQVSHVKEHFTYTPMRVQTSKGCHFYYRQPDFEIKNVGSKYGIDFRGQGGFVVAAGSIHSSGAVYTWDCEGNPTIDELPILTREDCNRMIAFNKALQPDAPTSSEVKEAQALTFDPVQVGSRNQTCASLSGKLIQQGHSLHTIKGVMDHWNGELPDPLSDDELNTTIASICTTHLGRGGESIAVIGKPDVIELPLALDLRKFNAGLYAGHVVKPTEWIVRDVFEVKRPYILAAMGGLGKSYSMLDLAVKIAMNKSAFHNLTSFGGLVSTTGTSVIFSAEDDMDEITNRLNAICNELNVTIESIKERLIIIPIPDLKGDFSVIRNDKNAGLVTTPFFEQMREQMLKIEDLKLVVFDTMQSMVQADIQSDNTAGQFCGTTMGALAAQTGAMTVFTHHMKKVGRQPINSLSDAREAIRGATSLVDSFRGAYAMWSAEENEAHAVCDALDIERQENRVVHGGLVKCNGQAKAKKLTFVRNDYGLLVDSSGPLSSFNLGDNPKASMLVRCIGYACSKGHPFSKTGKNSAYNRRNELDKTLHKAGRNELVKLIESLLDDGRIIQFSATPSGPKQYLDSKVMNHKNEGFKLRSGSLTPYNNKVVWDVEGEGGNE